MNIVEVLHGVYVGKRGVNRLELRSGVGVPKNMLERILCFNSVLQMFIELYNML